MRNLADFRTFVTNQILKEFGPYSSSIEMEILLNLVEDTLSSLDEKSYKDHMNKVREMSLEDIFSYENMKWYVKGDGVKEKLLAAIFSSKK